MGTLLRVAGEQTGYSEWIQLRACLADKLKNAITSQHWTLQTGYLPVPVYFRRCPLAGSNLCFSCVLLCLACTTCTALFTQPGSASHCPLPSLVAGTKEWKADATGVHTAAGQLLVDAAGIPTTGRSDCERATGNPVPRSRGHLPHPRGCHY